MNFAFITSAKLPDLYSDDQLAARELTSRGHHVTPVVWDHATVAQLNGFDAVVMRSPWDWYTRVLDFQSFLERLSELAVPVANPASMLIEFTDKTYLRRLEALGVPIVPTRWLVRDALETLPSVVAGSGWSRAIVKPSISANSNDTHLFGLGNVGHVVAALRQNPNHSEYLVQPYLREIEEHGEWSLVFFGGEYSHCVRKYPKHGDFRVQHDHGGRNEADRASPTLVRQATDIVHRAVPNAVYARVDGVVSQGQLLLMELEVVEPELFFRIDPAAPARFADALLGFVK